MLLLTIKDIFKILTRPCDSIGLIIVKLKRHMKYRRHVFFKPVQSSMIYEALEYLKTHKMFYKDTVISLGLTSNKIVDFSKLSETRSNSVTSEVENVEKAEDRGH